VQNSTSSNPPHATKKQGENMRWKKRRKQVKIYQVTTEADTAGLFYYFLEKYC